jgi:mTERF domain-containing protein
MVTKHPQLLHYSIDDGFIPRINFLRSIGMHNGDILKVLTSLTQVNLLPFVSSLKKTLSLLMLDMLWLFATEYGLVS